MKMNDNDHAMFCFMPLFCTFYVRFLRLKNTTYKNTPRNHVQLSRYYLFIKYGTCLFYLLFFQGEKSKVDACCINLVFVMHKCTNDYILFIHVT